MKQTASGLSISLESVTNDAHTTISPDRRTSMSFDREGRMIGFFRDGLTYRRGLDSRVVLRWREGKRRRRWLTDDETLDVFGEVYGLARDIATGLSEGGPHKPLLSRLHDEILPWTPGKLLHERKRFQAVYTPIPILPPDQYRSIVLQATRGCTWNRCTFCNFYQGQRFKMRSLDEFESHVTGVREFLGKGIKLREGIFIGDGNALAVKPEKLRAYMDVIRKTFPSDPLYGFVDVFSGERHRPDEWRILADYGVKSVYIGMETGYDPLLRFVNKPGSKEESIALVKEIKSAGIAVSLIVMVGLGGHQYLKPHTRETLDALKKMDLGEGDLLYLSPFIEHSGSRYTEVRQQSEMVPLSEGEVESELKAMATTARSYGIKTGRYDIRDFLY